MNRAFPNPCPRTGMDRRGGKADGNPDRVVTRPAARGFTLPVSTDGLTCSARARLYDTARSNPYWYHFPSLNVNAAGDLLLGFSGSRATEYLGAFYRARRANGTWMSRPGLVQAGRGAWTSDRWGDYSATSMDPNDGLFWTIQEYADSLPDSWKWGTWITRLASSP